jgi:hypothetical protein
MVIGYALDYFAAPVSLCLLPNFNRRSSAMRGVRTDPDRGARWFDSIFILVVPERKSIRP